MISQQRAQVVRGQPQLRRKNVHGSDWEQAERDILPRDPIYDFVDGAVTSSCDDFFITFGGGVARETLRFARAGGRAEGRPACDRFHLGAQTFRAGAPRRGVENDNGVFQGETGPGL